MPETIALLYHEVVDDYAESGFQNKDNLAYMHKTEVFRKHVKIFKHHLNNLKKSEENYIFTFDDGGISNLKSAAILEENDLKGIYFITTNRIGTRGFLKENDIRTLERNGHRIGGHSHTHPMIFRSLTYKSMLEEWRVSKEILENILGTEVLYCSVPGGDADAKTYESAVEAGFKFIFDSEPIVEPRYLQDSQIFGRLSVKAQTNEQQLTDMLSLKNLAGLQRSRKIKGTLKRLIFPLHQYIQNRKNG